MLSVGVVNGYKSQVEFSIKVVKSFSLFVELLLFHQIDFTSSSFFIMIHLTYTLTENHQILILYFVNIKIQLVNFKQKKNTRAND